MESLGYWLMFWVVCFFLVSWFFRQQSGCASWNAECTSARSLWMAVCAETLITLISSFFFSREWHFHQYLSRKSFPGFFSHMCFCVVFQGITFDEFRSFFQFLNNLEDFAIAMQMYNFASRSIGQGRMRAVAAGATHADDVFFLLAWCATSSRNYQNSFYSLSYQMSLREQCMWPLGWSWPVILYTPSSRSLT